MPKATDNGVNSQKASQEAMRDVWQFFGLTRDAALRRLKHDIVTTGKNYGAMMMGGAGDVEEIANSLPNFLGNALRQYTAMRQDPSIDNQPQHRALETQLPTSRELMAKFGGDEEHPSYPVAMVTAPFSPGEVKGAVLGGKALFAGSVLGFTGKRLDIAIRAKTKRLSELDGEIEFTNNESLSLRDELDDIKRVRKDYDLQGISDDDLERHFSEKLFTADKSTVKTELPDFIGGGTLEQPYQRTGLLSDVPEEKVTPKYLADEWRAALNREKEIKSTLLPDNTKKGINLQKEQKQLEFERRGLLDQISQEVPTDPSPVKSIFKEATPTTSGVKPSRVSMTGDVYRQPDEWQKKFIDLGDAQRGEPEKAMLKVTHMTGGGIINPTVEHVGDLTHRMTEKTAFANGDMGFEFVKPKVDRALGALRQGYGFEREFLENVDEMMSIGGKTRTELDDALRAYAQAHRKLPVYNEMQRAARDAAVALGEQKWATATKELEILERQLNKGVDAWVEAASKID